jgi:FkbM family methyltransferase
MQVYLQVSINKHISIKIEVEKPSGSSSLLYIGMEGGIDLAVIDLSNCTILQQTLRNLSVSKVGAGFYVLFDTIMSHASLIIGTASKEGAKYHSGSGKPQLILKSLQASDVFFKGSRPSLTVVDVGAAGGISPEWKRFVNDIRFVLFEPYPEAAAQLRSQVEHLPSAKVMEFALAGESGTKKLQVTKGEQCSSLLKPDYEILNRFSVRPIFEVVKEIDIVCQRYDHLFKCDAPKPDFIKMDTQGTELEILKGFGDLIEDCAGIVVEAHFYPLYQGQPLVGDVVQFLDSFDLALRDLRVCRTFDDEFVEVDCYFTKRIRGDTSEMMKNKVALIEEVYGLENFSWGKEIAAPFIKAAADNP